MTAATFPSPGSPTRVAPQTGGLLALALQESFTVAVRLRAGRQVATDADAFRAQIKHLLATADHECRRAGYSGDHVKLAVYAFVAFLDESVMNSAQPMFAGWPRQPLQEEVFGDHIAGETFFRHLDDLLAAQDAAEIADVLEVYQMCMLLGFRGRYAHSDAGGLHSRLAAVQQKILRIRGGFGPLAPSGTLPEGEQVALPGDPWVRRAGVAAGLAAVVAIGLYVVFRISLASDVAALQALAAGLVQ
jgi:type VI secretion system protein ImpK